MIHLEFSLLLLIAAAVSRASSTIYLDNCTFAVDLYRQYVNLLWSSNDSHLLHVQAVHALSSNGSLIPGQIYTHLSQSVALIPFFVRCTYPSRFSSQPYLPFTQCSSTISTLLMAKNYESTRTYLHLKSLVSLNDVPLLYAAEYYLLLSNCSFYFDANVYQLAPNDLFIFRIEFENSISEQNLSSCRSCNQRTSLCDKSRCLCRSGTLPLTLYQDRQFCVDATVNCSYDSQRCLHARSTPIFSTGNRASPLILLLSLVISSLLVLFLLFLWCLLRRASTHTFHCDDDKMSSSSSTNPSIYMIHRHDRTPSTISTTDSTKLSDFQPTDQHVLANEYVSTFYDDDERYPKIIAEQNNGEVVLILA